MSSPNLTDGGCIVKPDTTFPANKLNTGHSQRKRLLTRKFQTSKEDPQGRGVGARGL